MMSARHVRRALRRGRRVEVATLPELVGLLARLGPMAVHVMVLHGPHCDAARCVCRPTFVLEPLTEQTLREGQAAEERWLTETAEAVA